MENFNKLLTQLSHKLTSLRLTRNQLSNLEEKVYKEVMANDSEEKGYLIQTEIKHTWLKNTLFDQERKQSFIQQKFPCQENSYTIIVKYIVGRPAVAESDSKVLGSQQLRQIIREVFSLQLYNYVLLAKINEDLSKMVPSSYLKPTKTQFYDYVACQQLAIDIDSVSKALILPQLPTPIQRTNQQFPDSLSNYTTSTLDRTMQRLKHRVSNFGGQWLQ